VAGALVAVTRDRCNHCTTPQLTASKISQPTARLQLAFFSAKCRMSGKFGISYSENFGFVVWHVFDIFL